LEVKDPAFRKIQQSSTATLSTREAAVPDIAE